MKKDTETISNYHEKLVQAGVSDALIEQTKQTNLELTELLLSTPKPEQKISMNSLYRYYAAAATSDAEHAEE